VDVAGRISENMRADPATNAMEFGGRWRSWGQLTAFSNSLEGRLRGEGISQNLAIGIVARNRPAHVAVAVIERHREHNPTAGELDSHLRDRLASPQIPVKYLIVDALPYTASTNVNLKAVRELVEQAVAQA